MRIANLKQLLCVRYGNVVWSTGSVLPIWKEMFDKNRQFLQPDLSWEDFFTYDAKLVSRALINSKKFSGNTCWYEISVNDIINVWW